MNNLVTFVCDNSDNGVALFGYGNELLQLCSYFKYLNDNLLYSSCSDVDQRSMVIAQHSLKFNFLKVSTTKTSENIFQHEIYATVSKLFHRIS